MKNFFLLLVFGVAAYSEAFVLLQKATITRLSIIETLPLRSSHRERDHGYVMSDDSAANNSLLSNSEINKMLARRVEARFKKDYILADSIWQTLLDAGVYVDDKSRKWRADGARFSRQSGRDNGHGYTMAGDCGPNTSKLSDAEIAEMLSRRGAARLERNFILADSIRQKLLESGVYVEDKLKEWRADGRPFETTRGINLFEKYGPKGHDYQLFAECGPKMSRISDLEIDRLLAERIKAKVDRNYPLADKYKNELIDAGVFIHDSSRQFRNDGVSFDSLTMANDDIITNILICDTFAKLIDLQEKEINNILPGHVSFFWNQCAQITRNTDELAKLNRNPGMLYPLIKLVFSMGDKLDSISLGFTAHAIAKISSCSKLQVDPKLWDTLRDNAMKVKSFTAKQTGNILWSFAKANHPVPELFDKMATLVMSRLDDFARTPKTMSTTLWAYAKLGHPAPELLGAFSPIITEKANVLDEQDISNTLWAYSKLGVEDPELFDAIARTASRRLSRFQPRSISVIFLSFSNINHDVPQFFDAAEDVVIQRLQTFTPRQFHNVLTAYTNKGHKPHKLLEAVKEGSLKWNQFNSYEMMKVLEAYVKFDFKAPNLFDDLAKEFIAQIDRIRPSELPGILRPYAQVQYNCSELLDAVSKRIHEGEYVFSQEERDDLIWAYEELGFEVPRL